MRYCNSRSKFYRFIFFIALIVTFVGCAPPPARVVIWPSLPDPPRIKFIKAFKSLKGLKAGSSTKELLFGADPETGFVKPYAVHVDKRGRVFVSDTGRGKVFVFDLELGKALTLGLNRVRLRKTTGVTSDSSGRIYATDTKTPKVFVFNEDLSLTGILGKEGDIIRGAGIAVNDKIGRIYVCDSRKHAVVVFDMKTGKHIFDVGGKGTEEGKLNFPHDITIDSKGRLFVTDLNSRVSIFDADGRFIKSFGRHGDQPGDFARPKGLSFDSEGHIYVADAAFNNVQIFDDRNRILMAFSEGGNGPGDIILPAGLFVDKTNDNIYVVDQWNARVSIFQFLSERWKKENPEEYQKLLSGG